MSKEKLYGLRDQLSKFLYDPTPDQAAWRDKMWEEGRFDESIKITKQVETQLEEVETQIEAFEAAEPELGEKIVANTLLNLPLGKQLKGTGLGSLLGLAEEELGAAETQRLKDIEQKLSQLNSVYQQEGRGMEEMEVLKQEKEGLMSLIGKTPTTGEDLVTGTDWLAAEGMNKPPYLPGTEPLEIDEKKFVSKAFAQRNPTVVQEVRGTSEWFGLKLDEAELQKLSAEDAETAKDVLKRQRRVDKRMPEVQMYGEKEKRAAYREIDAEYQPYLDILNKKIKGYQAGGLVMNYGDYGRSYT
jgi:hypothetical protein